MLFEALEIFDFLEIREVIVPYIFSVFNSFGKILLKI